MNPPDFLYHYTSVSALIGMINSSCIWLTDADYLNDREERIFAKRLVLNALTSNNIDEVTKGFLDCDRIEFTRLLESFKSGNIGLGFGPNYGVMSGIFSMSEEGDSLAQWRAYGNQEVCIKSNRLRMESKCGDDPKNGLLQISYFDETYVDLGIQAELRQVFREYLEKSGQFGLHWPLVRALIYKHKGFASERDWRLIITRLFSGLPNDSWFLRQSGRYPVPTLTVPIDLNTDISGIIFGPGADERIVDHLKHVFTSSMNLYNWRIGMSSIPYRG